MKTKLLICISLIFALSAVAGPEKSLRKLKGTKEIICSPEGENGGMAPVKALAALKKGMTLRLLPGSYPAEISISKDKIIVIGDDPTRTCEVNLTIYGKGCLVKNIWISQLTAYDNLKVIDSLVERFDSRDKRKTKMNHFLYNTGLAYIGTSYRDTSFTINRCTIIGDTYPPIRSDAFSKWNISNSILFSHTFVFGVDIDGHKKAKLGLKNNVVYGKSGLATLTFDCDVKGGKSQAITPKELKRMVKLTNTKNIFEKPIFKKPTEAAKIVRVGRRCRVSSSSCFSYLRPSNFFLAPDSPGQGKGIITDQNPCFKAKKITAKKPKKSTPLEAAPEIVDKKAKDAWDKEWEKIANEAKKKKPRPRPKPLDDEEGEVLGGAPDQPK